MPDKGQRSNGEPCGSQRVIETEYRYNDVCFERIVWCDRKAGPCPYPGTSEANASRRICGIEWESIQKKARSEAAGPHQTVF